MLGGLTAAITKRLDWRKGTGDAGFEVDTNRALVLDAAGGVESLPLLTKDALADWLVERIAIALGTNREPSA
jgi:hypothetical protein